jgi:hypothetical protein
MCGGILSGLLAAVIGTAAVSSAAAQKAAVFTFGGQPGQTLDVLCDGKVAGRFMLAHDTSTPERKHETYKPYLHLFDAAGQAPITKGPGGEFTHHRGIFIGWNKISLNGKTYDRWHMKGGEQVVQGTPVTRLDSDSATVTATVHWNDEAGQPILVETRTMTFRRPSAPAYALIDFQSELKAPNGDVALDGDPEHAGIQFRPANEVDRSQTTYVYAGAKVDPHKAKDLAWIGESFTLNGKRYSVVDMNHPENPKETRISAYRNYGRFGLFPAATVKAGESLTLRYRFLVAEGAMPSADIIQNACNVFTGRSDPVPPVTEKVAEQPAPPKPKAAKKATNKPEKK